MSWITDWTFVGSQIELTLSIFWGYVKLSEFVIQMPTVTTVYL
jgi:hypothetical protein